MYLYDQYKDLTVEQLNEKISKMTNMITYYNMTGKEYLATELNQMVETCYFIIDEKMFIDYTKEYWPNDGVVIDTGVQPESEKEKNDKKVRRKRYI